jgi:hypothetical protein
MPVSKAGRGESCHPIYGNNMDYFSVADLPSRDIAPLAVLTAVAAPTTSAAQPAASRDIELAVTLSVAGATCDILVYRVDPGPVDTLIATIVGVNNDSENLYIGGFEGVNFDGRDVKVRAQNISSGTVTVVLKRK